MSHYQVSPTSLTPSRPAPSPQAQRRGTNDGPFSNALANSGYSSTFTTGSSSPSLSSYNSTYTGIGGAPTRGSSGDDSSASQVIRSGNASIKEDGFASWLWKAKWLVLRDQSLTIHKSEVRLLPLLSFFFFSPLNSTKLFIKFLTTHYFD